MNNIYVLNKNYRQIGVLSNQGANPQAPYYDDLYIQELDTGADTYQFSTMSTPYTQDLLEIGNHIMFTYNNRNELFTITSLEYSHYEGYKTISVYAEGIGFELLDIFMERPKGNGYSSGNDSDGDGDDNTDNEYADPDDMYLDENGIIIYDKDGSSRPKEEDMYVDGNGIITYKPNKRNNKNDSLEFKNISYPTFLNILLKNSGWSFVCQPGLGSVKHNISVKYDTNIYAILQDSMQAYRGVELEFVHEADKNGRIKKIVKAYKDGGRGSFVGKRFEYGTNVRGITKTQEVTDSEDDTVIRVDNVGVDVYYDIDFALKSAEIPEIEIGDTHYVIDRQFCPPMTIKARIGKIEVSFSDPTRNKITVANNKKIRGSAIEDELDEDSIKDIIDDYDSIIDDGIIDDGTGDDDYIPDDGYTPGDVDLEDLTSIEVNTALLTVPLDRKSYDSNSISVPDDGSLYPNLFIDKQDLLDFIMNEIYVCGHIHNDVVGKYARAGIPNFTEQLYLGIDANIEFNNNPLYLHRDHNSDGYNSWDDCEWKSKVGQYIVRKDIKDVNGDGDATDQDEHTTHSYNLPSLVAALIGAFQLHINKHSNNSGDSGNSGDGGNSGSSYDNNPVFETVTALLLMKAEEMETNTLDVNTIKFSDGTEMTTAGSGSSGSGAYKNSRLVAKDDDSLYAEYSSSGLLPSTNGEQNLGVGSKRWKAGCINEVFSKGMETNRIESCLYLLPFDSDDMNSVKQITDSSGVSKQDLLDFITKEIKVYEYIYTGDCNPDTGESGPLFNSLNYLGVLSKDFKSNAAALTMSNMTDDDGTVSHNTYNLPSLVTALIGAFQQHVANDGALGLPGGVIEYSYNDELNRHILTIAADVEVNNLGVGNILSVSKLMTGDILTTTLSADSITFSDGTTMTTAGSGSGSDYIEADYAEITELYVAVIGNNPDPMNEQYVEFRADIMMPGYTITAKDYNKPSDKSLKENIRYIDDTVMATSDDLLDKADLHDFIVNQVNLCEYNFIGDDSNKIGFIANDYEGTKVGDKIISRNGQNNTLTYNPDNLLFATIGALQEEVRMRDEKIASLEARLAAIEEMLNNK